MKKQPWHNLCDLQGLQGVIVEWGVFPQSLLQITNNRAQALPCGKAGECYMNVVSHETMSMLVYAHLNQGDATAIYSLKLKR